MNWLQIRITIFKEEIVRKVCRMALEGMTLIRT